MDAFELFYQDFPEYELYIYGDAVGNGAEDYLQIVKEKLVGLSCKDKVHLLPSCIDIHNVIKSYSMFVSSSDFEGMSNSMLEALAMGLPCVCTDCPAGGARAVIKDGENGLLVPVGDKRKLYEAMKQVAENSVFAKKLSQNGMKIRKLQSVDNIIKEWMKAINGVGI
jgi:glycosyltransferase involved in cell wall biosynthesis